MEKKKKKKKKRTKNYRWCVPDDRAICFSNKARDKVHNNHFDTRNPLSALVSSYRVRAEGFLSGFCVNIIMSACLNACITLDVSGCLRCHACPGSPFMLNE